MWRATLSRTRLGEGRGPAVLGSRWLRPTPSAGGGEVGLPRFECCPRPGGGPRHSAPTAMWWEVAPGVGQSGHLKSFG